MERPRPIRRLFGGNKGLIVPALLLVGYAFVDGYPWNEDPNAIQPEKPPAATAQPSAETTVPDPTFTEVTAILTQEDVTERDIDTIDELIIRDCPGGFTEASHDATLAARGGDSVIHVGRVGLVCLDP